MTQAPDAAAAAAQEAPPRRGWSLRARLLAGILLLLTLLGATIGIASTALLRASLIDRLDEQLLASAERASRVIGGPQGGPGFPGSEPPMVGGFVLGEGAGALGVLLVDGVVLRAGYLSESGEDVSLTAAQVGSLVTVPADARPHTVDLGAGLGSYRVVIDVLDTDTAVIVGLPLSEAESTVAQLALIVALATAGALLIALVLGTVMVRSALRPLARVAETATRVSELRLEQGEVELAERVPEAVAAPHTEVGRVGAALNRLLVRVESALLARQAGEERLRRFVADASHELRTPLASIRGYSEFLRLKGFEGDEDAVRSLARIESEAKRMTVLVEDLLLLARLDADPALERTEVDLSPLLADVLSDAHAASPEHRWELELPAEPLVVAGDAPRLHQAFANLLANARVHTPSGTRVVLAASAVGGRVRVSVTDEGPGIPEQLQPALFERFVRGETSRARAAFSEAGGSTGLGLAIVEAIVRAHGGTVTVSSAPGRTEFAVELPRAAEQAAGQAAEQAVS